MQILVETYRHHMVTASRQRNGTMPRQTQTQMKYPKSQYVKQSSFKKTFLINFNLPNVEPVE